MNSAVGQAKPLASGVCVWLALCFAYSAWADSATWVSDQWVPPSFCESVQSKCSATVDAALLKNHYATQQVQATPAEHRRFQADHWDIDTAEGKMFFSGHAKLFHDQQYVQADKMWLWMQDQKKIQAACLHHNVLWTLDALRMHSDTVAFYAPDNWRACGLAFEWQGHEASLRGVAKTMTYQGNNDASFDEVFVSSCPHDDLVWTLSADRMQLKNGVMHTEGAKISVLDHTVLKASRLRVPYRSKSGMVMPHVASFGQSKIGVQGGYRYQPVPGHKLSVLPFVTVQPAIGMQLAHQWRTEDWQSYTTVSMTAPKQRAWLYGGVSQGAWKAPMTDLTWRYYWVSEGSYPAQILSLPPGDAWYPYKSLKNETHLQQRTDWGLIDIQNVWYQRFKQAPRGDFQASNSPLQLLVLPRPHALWRMEAGWSSFVSPYVGWGDTTKLDQRVVLYGDAHGHVGRLQAVVGVWYVHALHHVPGRWRGKIVPNAELSAWLFKDAVWKISMDYAWTGYVPQDHFSVHRWPHETWPYGLASPQWSALSSRILDRNWLRLDVEKKWINTDWRMHWKHYLQLTPLRVTLTESGNENPLYQHPFGVSCISVAYTFLDAKATIVWPNKRVHDASVRLHATNDFSVIYDRWWMPWMRDDALFTRPATAWRAYIPVSKTYGHVGVEFAMRKENDTHYGASFVWEKKQPCAASRLEIGADIWRDSNRTHVWPRVKMRMDIKGLQVKTPQSIVR